jgi:arginyl-tRNA synthetase
MHLFYLCRLKTQQNSTAAYQCAIAMKLVSTVKSQPNVIAKKIVDNLAPFDLISNVGISGPGFINIHLNLDVVSRLVGKVRART